MQSHNYTLLQKNIEEISVDIALLDTAEHSRYGRLLDSSKKLEFLAGRCFLKRELAAMAGIAPQEIKLSLSSQGKPYYVSPEIKYPHFNMSHSGGMVALAFAEFPVGVDLETNKNLELKSLKPIFTDHEYAVLNDMNEAEQQKCLLQLFTMKEAFIKATDKKWGLDVISFDWLQSTWQLQQPSVNCEFHVDENEKYTTSVCLVRGE